MKKQILTVLILSSLSISAFALPQNNPQPLLGEMQDSSVKTLMGFGSNLQAEGSADRTYKPQMEHMQVAESSADRTHKPQMGHLRVAESSADRTYKPQMEHMQVAESSADRTYKPQTPGKTA